MNSARFTAWSYTSVRIPSKVSFPIDSGFEFFSFEEVIALQKPFDDVTRVLSCPLCLVVP
jgi:hypothetical protein